MASAGVEFRTGTFPSSDECIAAGSISQLDALACTCASASPDAGSACSACCITHLFEDLSLSDAAASNEYPGNVTVFDDPLPLVAGNNSVGALDAAVFAEVMVTGDSRHTGGGSEDPLRAAMQSLAAPIGPDTDPVTLEALRVMLLENATKMAAMKLRAEATQREIDRIAAGTPAAAGPSRLSAVRQCGAAIASMLGVGRIVYDTPAQNLCAAQAAAAELKNLEGAERQSQMEHLQELIDAANA